MIVFEHAVSAWLIWLGAGAVVALTLYAFVRYVRLTPTGIALAVLRLLFLALLTWCLLMPERRVVTRQVLRPRLLVALDTSRSMLLAPPRETTNRWARARDTLNLPWVQSLSTACEVDVFPFAARVEQRLSPAQALAVTASGDSTRLREALGRLAEQYRGQSVVALLLLSDGLDTREPNDDWAAQPPPWPVYSLALEPTATWETEPDLRVDSASTPQRVTVGWNTELKAVVSGQGTKGLAVNVALRKDGVLMREVPTVIPAEGGSKEVTFLLEHPQVGVFTYEVAAPPLPGESRTNDNAYAVSVQVVDARNRLLYVEGPPRWESKYLTRALTANGRVTPLCFIRGPGNRFLTVGQKVNAAPDMSDAQLALFKIVIVGNLDAEELGVQRAQNLQHFVEAGGSLVLLGGPKAWGPEGFVRTSLQNLLPAKTQGQPPQEGRYPVQLTSAGQSHPAFGGEKKFWTTVPPVLSIFPGVSPTPGAEVLAAAQTPDGVRPLIVAQRYGQGKVVAIYTDSFWRWQLNPDKDAAEPYQRFWNQVLAWLSPSEEQIKARELEIYTEREQIYLGEALELSARLSQSADKNRGAQAAPQCVITLPDGRRLPFAMRANKAAAQAAATFGVSFTPETPGLHRAAAAAEIAGRSVESEPISFFVKPFTPESVPRPANTNVLSTLARQTGGQFLDSAQALDAALAALKPKGREEESVAYRSLWQVWPVLACLLGLLAVEWAIRKIKDMP